MRTYPIILVEWLDVDEPGASWQSEAEVKKFCALYQPVTSVGYLFGKTKHFLIIFGDRNIIEDEEMYGRIQKIPLSIVKKVRYLRKGGAK